MPILRICSPQACNPPAPWPAQPRAFPPSSSSQLPASHTQEVPGRLSLSQLLAHLRDWSPPGQASWASVHMLIHTHAHTHTHVHTRVLTHILQTHKCPQSHIHTCSHTTTHFTITDLHVRIYPHTLGKSHTGSHTHMPTCLHGPVILVRALSLTCTCS